MMPQLGRSTDDWMFSVLLQLVSQHRLNGLNVLTNVPLAITSNTFVRLSNNNYRWTDASIGLTIRVEPPLTLLMCFSFNLQPHVHCELFEY